MRILHSYCLNYNLGDYALGIGVKNLLRKYLDVSLIAETNLQGREFNKYYIREVLNKKYDLLVLGGGGIIHGSHWPNGWFWLIEKDLIKEIQIPFIVYGVGVNYWKEEGDIPDRGIFHLKETLKYATYFSVRNDGSSQRFQEQIGIQVSAIPDPGFHVNINESYKRVIQEPYVIIQLANDKPENRFGSLKKRSRFIDKLKTYVFQLSKKYKVIFAPHVFEDIVLSEEVAEGIENTQIWDFGYFAFDHTDDAIAYYKYADFVIAMRGHGQIIPISFNTPVIALENHPKHRGLMENLGLIDFNVNISEPDFSIKLQEAITKVQDGYESITEKYRNINYQLQEDTRFAFENIKAALNNR